MEFGYHSQRSRDWLDRVKTLLARSAAPEEGSEREEEELRQELAQAVWERNQARRVLIEARQQAERAEARLAEFEFPWNHPRLRDWSIVGMNHYFVGEERHLYVAMTDREVKHCIRAHGSWEAAVFADLRRQAAALAADQSEAGEVDPATLHDPRLTPEESRILGEMWEHPADQPEAPESRSGERGEGEER